MLGIPSTGRGNNIARSLGIPLDYKEACKRLFEGNVKEIDAGKANGEYFFGNAGIGFTAECAKNLNRVRFLRKNLPQAFLLNLSIFMSFFIYKNEDMIIKIEKKNWRKIPDVAIGNGAVIAPRAGMQDGLLDVILLEI